MSNVKICHFVNVIDGKSDGVFNHLKLLLLNMDKERYNQMIVFQGNAQIEQELNEMGIRYFILPDLNNRFPIKSFIPFYKIIKKNRIDIIHIHSIKPYVIAGITNIILKRKAVFNYHGGFIKSVYRNWLTVMIYRAFHLLIVLFKSVPVAVVPSKRSITELQKDCGAFRAVSHYYNSTIICSDRNYSETRIHIPEDKVIVAVVARMAIEKRIDVALRVVQSISRIRNDVFFMFFGDGPLENEIKNLISELNIQEYVKFCGYVPDLSIYYRKINILLNTSDSEGFPISVWEALSYGIPVVASDVGGIQEIVEKENCGIVFPKRDVGRCVNALIKIIDNPDLFLKMSNNSKKIMSQKYTVENFIRQMEQVYTSL